MYRFFLNTSLGSDTTSAKGWFVGVLQVLSEPICNKAQRLSSHTTLFCMIWDSETESLRCWSKVPHVVTYPSRQSTARIIVCIYVWLYLTQNRLKKVLAVVAQALARFRWQHFWHLDGWGSFAMFCHVWWVVTGMWGTWHGYIMIHMDTMKIWTICHYWSYFVTLRGSTWLQCLPFFPPLAIRSAQDAVVNSGRVRGVVLLLYGHLPWLHSCRSLNTTVLQ